MTIERARLLRKLFRTRRRNSHGLYPSSGPETLRAMSISVEAVRPADSLRNQAGGAL
jgi:hypothetical protein